MTLREDQVQRYGRQILLREVGGKGQEKLLHATVSVRGEGAALDEAVTYLAAGGTPMTGLSEPVEGGPGRNFLAGASLGSLNPDALAAGTPSITLATSPGPEAALVVLGKGVAYRRSDACSACFSAALGLLEPGEGPAGTGSLAALAVQRIALGWGDPLGLVRWSGSRFETASPRCPRHA
jgi:hypothetical protein